MFYRHERKARHCFRTADKIQTRMILTIKDISYKMPKNGLFLNMISGGHKHLTTCIFEIIFCIKAVKFEFRYMKVDGRHFRKQLPENLRINNENVFQTNLS